MNPDHAAPVEDLFKDSGMNTSQVEYGQNDYLGSELWLPGYEHLIDIPENLLEHPGVQGLSVPTQKVTMTTSQFGEHPNRQSVAQCSNSEKKPDELPSYDECDSLFPGNQQEKSPRELPSYDECDSLFPGIPQGEILYECADCAKSYPNMRRLFSHMTRKHDLFSECDGNTSQVEYGEDDYLGSELWLPGYEHLIDIPEYLRMHPGAHGLSVPTQEETTSQFSEHHNRQSAAQCSYSESTEHKRIHTGEGQFQCDECGMSFKRKYQLQQHGWNH
ncbi:Zinc finger protein, partial [Pseudolycoriella hygida]